MCEYKVYEIYKIYKDAGISAKDSKRPAYQEMIQDSKDKKINVIVAFKLDRLTRSVFDIEKLMKFVNNNDCSIDCMADESNWIYVKFLDTIFRTNYAVTKLVI